MTYNITFEFYGKLQGLTGQSSLSLTMDTPLKLEQALQQLAFIQPEISSQLKYCACAIGDEMVLRSELIQKKTKVALLPPISGG